MIFAKSADTPTTTVRCEFRVDESSPLYVQRLFRTPSTRKPRLSRIPFPNTTRMPRGDPLFLAETFPTSSVCFYSRYSPRPFHANCRVFFSSRPTPFVHSMKSPFPFRFFTVYPRSSRTTRMYGDLLLIPLINHYSLCLFSHC